VFFSSLGSCILFDLLQHQGDQSEAAIQSSQQLTNGQPEHKTEQVKEPTVSLIFKIYKNLLHDAVKVEALVHTTLYFK